MVLQKIYWSLGSALLTFLVFDVILLCVFTLWAPCCDVRYDVRIKTMFGSSLPSVICRSAHILLTLFVFTCAEWCDKITFGWYQVWLGVA